MSQQMNIGKKNQCLKLSIRKKSAMFLLEKKKDKEKTFSHVFFLSNSAAEWKKFTYVESTQTKKDPKAIAVKIFLYMHDMNI